MSTLWSTAFTIFFTALFLLVIFNYRTRQAVERYKIKAKYEVYDDVFFRSMEGVLAAPFLSGNKITTLNDGVEIFPEIIAAVKQATTSITIESFVCSSGVVCDELIDALKERAQAGVKVHVLIDWMGSKELRREQYKEMKMAGIQVVKYRKLHWYTLPRLNNRSHRKIIVIDGKIGFTGGAGIADQWMYPTETMPAWRDIHYRIEGPAVARLQSAFSENWLKSHTRVLEGERYFPKLEPVGDVRMQVFTSSADGIEAVRLMYLMSVACAKKSIRLLSAYFVPDRALTYALIHAKQRGVQIEIMIPGDRTDHHTLQEVTWSAIKRLLREGIPVYEYQPTMHHGKLFIVDDEWVSVGSANCNSRSFAINDEMNVNISHAAFAKEQIALFDNDKQHCRLITYETWKCRPAWRKGIGTIARLIQEQF